MMDMLKTILDFIKENHPDACVPAADENCFTVNSDSRRKPGYRRTVYNGGGWEIAIGRPVTPEKIYNIRAEYQNRRIIWKGRIINGKIEENSYDSITP
jgi:hypothetical protein